MKFYGFTVIVFLALLLIATYTAHSQQFEYEPYQSQYVPNNNDELLRELGKTLNDRYEQNKKYRDKLIDWVSDLKSKTNDQEFTASLDKNYQDLRAMDNGAFEKLGSDLDNIKFEISEEIDKYNKRVEESNKASQIQKLYNNGIESLHNKDYNTAIQYFTQYLEQRPFLVQEPHAAAQSIDYQAYYARAYAYKQVVKYSESVQDINIYVQYKPDDPRAYSLRGWDKYYLKDYAGALSDFNYLINLDPSAYGYYARGEVYSGLGKFDLAISDDSKAIELKPDFSMAYNNRGWHKFKLNMLKEALTDLNKSIELDERNDAAYDSRQEIKFALKDYKGCLEDCNMAILLNPSMANSIFFRGRVYYKQGKKDKACEEWKKAGDLGKIEALQFISKFCEQ